MKTLIGIIVLIVWHPLFSFGEGNYEKAMKDALDKLNHAASVDELLMVANQFDRIGDVEAANWLPDYHAAYARVMMAAMEQDTQKKDAYLDAAQLNLDALEAKEHDVAERLALHGFLIMIRMSVDPSRGMELGMDCGMIVHQAYEMNKQNPRAVLMLAQFNFGSAQYMGEDLTAPCAMFDEALQLLDQPTAEPSVNFSPNWGKEMALTMKQQCPE